jgi:hypothetical protein
MPHLFLPSAHTDADLVLAADVAAAVDSADLYVAWTHEAGAGGTPEVEAVVRDSSAPSPAGHAVNPFAELFLAMMAGVAALWKHLTHVPPHPASPRALAGGDQELSPR